MSATTYAYKPSRWQAEFHAMPVDEGLGGGSVGPGKSMALLNDANDQVVVEQARAAAKEINRSKGWALHIRKELPMLEQTIWRSKQLFPVLDSSAKYSENDHKWVFYSSGYQYQFGHLKDPDSYLKYRSNEYCVARETKIVMGDGSRRAIQDIKVGDLVMTLEGPKKVTATVSPGKKLCVRADAYVGTRFVGSQVQPTTHPLLSTAEVTVGQSWQRSRNCVRWTREFRVWLDYESLLYGRRESPAKRVSQVGGRNGSSGSGGSRPEASLLPRLTVPVVLHAPSLPSGPSQSTRQSDALRRLLEASRLQSQDAATQSSRSPWDQRLADARDRQALAGIGAQGACGGAYGQLGQGIGEGFQGGYRQDYRFRDAQLQAQSGTGQVSSPSQGDVASHSQIDWPPGALGNVQAGSPDDVSSSYRNFYTGRRRQISERISPGTCVLTPVGEVEVFDLTVEDANHYISDCGLINLNTWLGFDELAEIQWKDVYDELVTRVRTADPVLQKMLKVRGVTNPAPGWVRDYFIEPNRNGREILEDEVTLRDGTKRIRTRMFLPAKLWDNPDPNFISNYEASLRHRPKHIRAALLEGDWFVVPGAFFSDVWDVDRVVIKPFKIPSGWHRFRSGDWGYKEECVILWWAVTPDRELICYRERTYNGTKAKRRMDAGEVARAIKEIEMANGEWNRLRNCSRLTGPMDNQLWEERGRKGPTMADDMAKEGVYWQRATKGRVSMAQQLITRLGQKGYDGRPGIMFFEDCQKCIQTIPSIGTDELEPEKPKDGGPDHWYAATGYACAANPVPSGKEDYSARDDDDNDGFGDQPFTQSRGDFGYGAW